MRILLIGYFYHPDNNARAFRWTAISEHWAKQGILVDVVCAGTKREMAQSSPMTGIQIYRTRDFSKKMHVNAPSVASKSSGYFIRLALKKIVSLLRWPDHAWLWMPSAHRQATRLLMTNQYDAIISISMPFSAHVVAFFLTKWRKSIPWICDYGDPFSFVKEVPINNRWLYGWLNRWFEQKVNHQSQKISVTTIETAQEHERYLRIPAQWLHVIPPLAKRKITHAISSHQIICTQNAPIHLVFAGILYATIRNPTYCLKLLSAVRSQLFPRQLIVHFYGGTVGCESAFEPYQQAIGDWIFLHGALVQSELWTVYNTADVLINIGNATRYQVPSKVIEYMTTGLPILNITTIEQDSSTLLLDMYPESLTICQKIGMSDAVVNAVSEFIHHSKKTDLYRLKVILKKYQIEDISDSYLRLFCEIKQPETVSHMEC